MKFCSSTSIAIAVLLAASTASAQSDDAVIVLTAGGVESVDAFDVVRDPDARVTNLGMRRVVPANVGLTTIADVKVLPDGSYLLADVGGRGAVVSTPDGAELGYVLDPMSRYTGASSASVASYFAPGEPSLLLLGDSGSSAVSIRSTSTGDVSWFRSLRLATSAATVAQAIVLPQNRVAVALRWQDVGVSAVEVHEVGAELGAPLRFVSAMHTESAPADVVVAALDQVRDLVGLEDGNLLVTSRSDVLELSLEGVVVNQWSTGDFAALNGELASARWLPSGNIAVVTFQPGEWVRPHTNHRVHWLDPQTSQIVATSEALSRAPVRVEPLRGSGGTGTVGFDAGLDDLQQGDPASVELEEIILSPKPVRIGGALRIGATVRNGGAFPVALSALVVRGSVGPCGSDLPRDHDFATASAVALVAGQSYSFGGEEPIDAQFATGEWCAWVEGVDRQGTWHRYGAGTAFEIAERAAGSGSQIEVTPLPFGDDIEDVDSGVDAGADGGPVDDWVAKRGCCASSGPSERSGNLALLCGLLFMAAVRTRRSRP